MFTNTSSETFACHKKFGPGSCVFTSIANILIGKVDEYKTTTTTTKYAYKNFGLCARTSRNLKFQQNICPWDKNVPGNLPIYVSQIHNKSIYIRSYSHSMLTTLNEGCACLYLWGNYHSTCPKYKDCKHMLTLSKTTLMSESMII